MSDSYPVCTPLGSHKLQKPNSEESIKKPFQQLIGSLMYLAIWTRPDITYSVSALRQFNNLYDENCWKAAKPVMQYLKGTSNYSIKYSKSGNLSAYSDADWASCNIDRRSYTGFVIFYGKGPISWEARKQRNVANSSTEAEYTVLLFLTSLEKYVF